LGAVAPQSDAIRHDAPGACLFPHICVNVLQGTPTQSVSTVQLVRHCVALRHLKAPQSVMLGVQVPVPLHVDGDFRTLATPAVALSVHDCRPQVVVAS
jgi:hypothetical protein